MSMNHFLLPPPPSAEDLARTPPAVLAWFEARILLLEEIIRKQEERIRVLEARLTNNSSNSNKPPSSDPPFRQGTAKSSGKKKGRKKRAGARQKLLEPTEVRHCLPETCTCGCREIADEGEYYRHQHIEVRQPALDVTHFVLHRGRCTGCGKITNASIPHEFRFGFGSRLHALIVELCGIQGVSREGAQSLLQSIFHLSISQGGMQKCLDRASQALQPHYDAIKEAAHAAPVNYVDETTWRRFGPKGKRLLWLWVMASPSIAYFKVATKRSKDAFDALIGDWRGILVSDGYGVYRTWKGKARQTCLAHLIRAAKKLLEGPTATLAACGSWAHAELVRLCRMAHTLPTFGAVDALHARICRWIKKYRDNRDDAGRFARRVEKELACLKIFRQYKGVSPTNNHAERCLRFGVTWRKRSCGTTSEKGDRFVERVLSLRHTSRLQGRSTFTELVEALTHYARGTTPSVVWGGA